MTSPKEAASSGLKLDPRSADDYQVDVDMERGLMRITFRNATGPLSYQVFTSDEVYDFSRKLLRGYDRLEGLDK
jgi:hypothetical protein